MKGLKIGHFTHQAAGTGVTVFLLEQSAVGSYWVCGSAPASHEFFVLDPDNSVPRFHGLVFAGGSAYGLYAAKGVMTYLTEKNIGHVTPHGKVPIVPAAAIYDLSFKKPIAPTDSDAYQACLSAKENNLDSGQIGAGTGATVGKLVKNSSSMQAGLGVGRVSLPSGIEFVAYAVVNAVGDVIGKEGQIIAGAKNSHGQFANSFRYLLSGQGEIDLFDSTNTTIVAVFTNAKFTKEELKRIAKMAVAGIACTIAPSFTRFDGDVLFCISVGEQTISELTAGVMATEAVKQAIWDVFS